MQGSGEKWKLVKARVTPYFDKVFATRQNLADCCAKCFACANRVANFVASDVASRVANHIANVRIFQTDSA
jgi:hypothetical protein